MVEAGSPQGAGWSPTDIAGYLGCSTDDAMDRFVVAVKLARLAGLAPTETREEVYASELMGPAEVCELFAIERNTLVLWRRRESVDFPLPLLELSGMPLWTRAVLETWGLTCGRLEVQESASF
jgi:hypothetical protein